MAKLIPKQTEQDAKDGWSSADLAEEVFHKISERPKGEIFVTCSDQVDDVIVAMLELGYLEREQ